MPAYATPSLSCKAPVLCRCGNASSVAAKSPAAARDCRACACARDAHMRGCALQRIANPCAVFLCRRVRACHHKEYVDTCLSMSLVLTTSSGQVAAAAIAPAKAPHVADCSGSHGDTCNSPTRAVLRHLKESPPCAKPESICRGARAGSMNRVRDRRGQEGRTGRDERGKSLGQKGLPGIQRPPLSGTPTAGTG